MIRCAALLLAIPLTAQAPVGDWVFGVYVGTPTMKGKLKDRINPLIDFDLKNNFSPKGSNTGLGVQIDYSGTRFGFSLDYAVNDYEGQSRINGLVAISGLGYMMDVDVDGSIKNSAFDFVGTYKVWQGSRAWLGANLGIQAWYLDITAEGRSVYHPEAVKTNKSYVVPIPQIGISAGYEALQSSLILSGKAHFMVYKGASYTRFSSEVRYYPLPWLGIRAFAELQNLDSPEGSINSDLELKLDRNTFGIGVVARW